MASFVVWLEGQDESEAMLIGAARPGLAAEKFCMLDFSMTQAAHKEPQGVCVRSEDGVVRVFDVVAYLEYSFEAQERAEVKSLLEGT